MRSSFKGLGTLLFGGGKYNKTTQYEDAMGTLYERKGVDIDEKPIDFKQFDQKVTLITNVACKCGYTAGSYSAMQELSKKYTPKGLNIMLFPTNQFMNQEPWEGPQIKAFVSKEYPELEAVLFKKADVNGKSTQPTYAWLKQSFPGDVAWNFGAKFLIDKKGIPIARFDHKEEWKVIEEAIVTELEHYDDNAKSNEKGKGKEKEKEKDAQVQEEAEAKEKEEDEQEKEKDKSKKEVAGNGVENTEKGKDKVSQK